MHAPRRGRRIPKKANSHVTGSNGDNWGNNGNNSRFGILLDMGGEDMEEERILQGNKLDQGMAFNQYQAIKSISKNNPRKPYNEDQVEPSKGKKLNAPFSGPKESSNTAKDKGKKVIRSEGSKTGNMQAHVENNVNIQNNYASLSQDMVVEVTSLDTAKHSVVRHKEIPNNESSLDTYMGPVSILKRTGGMVRPPDSITCVNLKGSWRMKMKSKKVSSRNVFEVPSHFSVPDLGLVDKEGLLEEDEEGEEEVLPLLNDDNTHIK